MEIYGRFISQFDSGGPIRRNILTTFSKARLACTVPGVVPIEYSEIRKYTR